MITKIYKGLSFFPNDETETLASSGELLDLENVEHSIWNCLDCGEVIELSDGQFIVLIEYGGINIKKLD